VPSPPDMTEDQAIEQLKKLPRERQALVLKGIPAEKQQQILKRLQGDVPPSFWQAPGQYLQKRSQELRGEAQRQMYLGLGPESNRRSLLARWGHQALAFVPEAASVIDDVAAGLTDWKNAAALIVSKFSPQLAAAFFASQGAKQAYEALQKGDTSPDNVRSFLLGLATVGGATLGSAEMAPQSAAAIGKTTEAVKGAPELIRRGGQVIAGVGPERTTRPLVEKFQKESGEVATKQAAENKATEEANRAKVEKYQTQKREAFQAEEEARAQHTLETEEVNARNQAQTELQTRRGNLARDINQASREIGEGVKAAQAAARKIGNEKYAPVHEAVAQDEGVEIAPLADAVKKAQDQDLKGSPESIRQFNDILHREAAAESELGETRQDIMESQGMRGEYEDLTPSRKGLVDKLTELEGVEGAKVKFDDLQGWSTEIGMRLAKRMSKGGQQIPGDVLQALQHVKEAIDKQKTAIAERNNVGPALKEADSYWRNFMGTFWDRNSAVNQVYRRVGVLDPEYYSEPFTSGKAAKTGIDKLRAFDPALAGRIEDLRKQNEEFKGLPKKGKVEEAPELPSPAKQPRKPELEAPKQFEKPKAPGVEEARQAKRSELAKSAREVGRLSKYDAAILASSVIGPRFGRWEALLIDPALIVARKGIGQLMDRPKISQWLSKPSAEDLRILSEVNPEVQATVKANLTDFIRQEESRGHHISIAPELGKWLGKKAAGLVKRGAEIVKGEKGSLEMPPFDWSKTSSVGAGEGDAFAAAKQELYPDKRELTNAEISEVSRRAAELTAERKASAGSRQGVQPDQQKVPGAATIVGKGRAIVEGEGGEPISETERRRGPGEQPKGKDIPSLRRRAATLRTRYEAAEDAQERWRLREKLLTAENELAEAERGLRSR
jgi:hypothetical protein